MNTTYRKQFIQDVVLQSGKGLIALVIILGLVINLRVPYFEEDLSEKRFEYELEAYKVDFHKAENSLNEIKEYNEYLLEKYDLPWHGRLKVRVEINTQKTNSSGIGNELSYLYLINGEAVQSGKEIVLNVMEPLEIYTEIRENDPSIDDVGDASFEEYLLINELSEGRKVIQNIEVHETRGKDAGNTAKFQVSYTLKLVPPVYMSSGDVGKAPTRHSFPVRPEKVDVDVTFLETVKQDAVSQIILLCGTCVFLILVACIYVRRKKELMHRYEEELERKKREEQYKIECKKRQEKEEAERKKRFYEGRAACIARLGGKSIRDAAGVPSNITFIDDDLPVDNNDTKYGSFTVYRTRTGTRYHNTYGCSSASRAVHVFVAQKSRLTPCQICGGACAVPKWYTTYLELKDECKKYGLNQTNSGNQA